MVRIRNKLNFVLSIISLFLLATILVVSGLLVFNILVPITGNINTSANLSCTPNSFNLGNITAGIVKLFQLQ